jgi:hypothetical protein
MERERQRERETEKETERDRERLRETERERKKLVSGLVLAMSEGALKSQVPTCLLAASKADQ